MTTKITLFKDDNGYLSNFYPCFIVLDGDQYPSVEHAFQAAKVEYGDITVFAGPIGKGIKRRTRDIIRDLPTPGKAKRYGRTVKLRPGWEDMKIEVMEGLVRYKFANN